MGNTKIFLFFLIMSILSMLIIVVCKLTSFLPFFKITWKL